MQPTEKLYEADAALTDFTATVLACTPQQGGWAIVLDRTAFYPEGGGQPCDTGTLGGAAVTDVHRCEADGSITHTCAAPLPVGQTVPGQLDAARRRDFMQQHSGEHILSGTLHRLFGAENVGFHIGEPAVRMDVDLPLTPAQLAEAEREANAVVQANLPFRCWYPTPDALAAANYRSKKPIDGAVRLVDAAGADLCACCGTHVTRSGEVGLIKILSAQGYKGGVRLAVACGQRAYTAVAAAWADAEAAGRLLSAAPSALAEATARLAAAEMAAKQRIAILQRDLADALAAAAAPGKAQVLRLDGADADGAHRTALAICAKSNAVCAVFVPGKTDATLTYALAAPDGCDLRPLAKRLNEVCLGRGGAKPSFCQGSIPAEQFAAAQSLLTAHAE